MPKDYPSVILPPIWREAIEMPPVYPSSAPLVCFQENKKDFRYIHRFVFLFPNLVTGHIYVYYHKRFTNFCVYLHCKCLQTNDRQTNV